MNQSASEYSLHRLGCRGIRCLGEDEVDEEGGEGEDGTHHGEGKGEATNLVQGPTHHRTHNLSWRREEIDTVNMSLVLSQSIKLYPGKM